MAPFALLCRLLDAWLARQPVAAAVVEALGPATPWPRLVTLSGVHLLTPALAPALAGADVRPRVPVELMDIWRRCTRPLADATWRCGAI